MNFVFRSLAFFAFVGLLLHPLDSSVCFSAEQVKFPENELPQESVLPVFDGKIAVKNRYVVTEKRIEVGGLGGFLLTEPFKSSFNFGADLTFHFDEVHGLNLIYSHWLQGESSYARQLREATQVNLKMAPQLDSLLLGSYQWSAWYGKISLSKYFIMNTALFALGGVGVARIGGESTTAGSVGLGQKFYFNDRLALRWSLRFLIYQGPKILSKDLNSASQPVPPSQFDKTLMFNNLLTVGLVYLI